MDRISSLNIKEKLFTDDEIFDACALIIERKSYKQTPESVAKSHRRDRKIMLIGIFVFVVLTAISIVLKSPFATVAIAIFAMIALSLFNKDVILAFNEGELSERRKMIQIYRELNNQRETDKEAFARAYLAKAKAEYDAQMDAKHREIFGTDQK